MKLPLRFLIPLALFLVLALFLMRGLSLDPREVPSPLVGKPAPAFSAALLAAPDKTMKKDDLLGKVYLLGVAAAALQAAWHYTLIRHRSREGCFKAFRLNHWVGLAVFAGVAADLALRT